MIIPVKVPTVGESITEGILAEWKVADGAFVNADEALFELETDKVSMTVTAEKAGRISFAAKVGDTVLIGSTVATIDTDAVGQVSKPVEVGQVSGSISGAGRPDLPKGGQGSVPVQDKGVFASEAKQSQILNPPPLLSPTAGIETLKANLNDLAPSVRRIVTEEHLDPAQISGTGKGGRITKEDALNATVGQVSEPVSGG
jgi:2-oxoglutarate dehydrogenase E2 component (dihydrolipoamide succinyltransferase)